MPRHALARLTQPALLGLVGLCAAGQAWAQTAVAPGVSASSPTRAAPAPAPATSPASADSAPLPARASVFPIRGFSVTGDNPLGESETTRVLAPFVRRDATIQTLQQATAALEAALREQGFGLHRVALPPQELGRSVTLHVVHFAVGKVETTGRSINDVDNIRRSLPELQEGRSPNFKQLAIQAAIANENPNKQIQLGLRESEQPDTIDANITVREQRPWTLGLAASNSGSKTSGRDRVTVSGGHTNVFNRDHQFVGAYTTSFDKHADVKQLGAAYKVPLYQLGGVLGASYTRSDVVGNFGSFSSTGAGHTAGLNYTHYLAPQGGRRSYLSVGLEDKVFDASRINDIVIPGALDRRSRPLLLGYAVRREADSLLWGYNVELAANTGSGSDNDLASYQSEDPRITTIHWKALRGGFSYSAPLAKTWVWTGRGLLQYSPDVLISGEQFGLGGLSSVRGTSMERPISGDKGASGSLELSTPELAAGLRLLGFIDAGWLANNAADGFAKPRHDRLASAGLGLRYGKGSVSVSADYGRIVLGSRVLQTLNAAAPEKGDDKLYVSLSVRF